MTRAIDLFAGAGGFTLGATRAGVDVVWAANHWKDAVAVHANNHPTIAHECQDLRQADWSRVPKFDLLLASPACQGHSQASQPNRSAKHDADRSTAWAVIDCLDACSPEAAIVENVPEFRNWRLYKVWQYALSELGYTTSEHVLDAADHGVPQRRKRLFVVATRSKAPIELKLPQRAHRPVSEVLELDVGRWQPIHRPGRGAGALRRIAKARARGLGQNGAPFIIQHVTGHPGRSIDRPLCTVTTKDQLWVVKGDTMRAMTIPELKRAMGFPDTYQLDVPARWRKIKMLGNAVAPPVATDVISAVLEAA